MRAAHALAVVLLTGCSGHYLQAMEPVHRLAREGKPAEAAELLKARTDGTQWDALLVALDRGALLHRAGRWQDSAEALNAAIAIADDRETVSLGEETFGRAPFRMANHEKQALHALQAINYLMLGKNDDAVVEARLTDLRQTKLQAEKERSAADEKFVTGSTVDERQREFFEQLVFGRYVSALARERAGDLDGAFIDYQRAWQIREGAPPDARIEPQHLLPKLCALGLARQRPVPTGCAPEPPAPGTGELVLIVEQGFAPRAVLDEQVRAYRVEPAPRAELPVYAVAGGPVVPAVLTSLEELATRRGYLGLLVDRERSATVGVNTVLFAGYFVLFPVAMPLLIKRAWETTMRDAQSWATLPAELAVARVRLPAGTHTVKVPGLTGLVEHTVEVRAGEATLLVAEGP